MFLLKNLVSSITKVTQDLGNVVSVNPVVNTGSPVNVNVSDINIANGNVSTSGLLSNVLSTVTNTVSHATTGLVSDVVGTVTGTAGSTNPLGTITNVVGGLTGGVTGGSPVGGLTNVIGGVTGAIGGVTGGATGSNPVGTVTDIIGGVTGGVVGGGTSPLAPVVNVVQSGIDVLQGVESLKTSIINTGINTVADTVVGVLPQTEHPVTDIAHLGTLTFETSRDTVNGALETVSHLVGGDIQGATQSATGILGTLVHNGSTATGILTDILGGVTGAIGGVTGGATGGNPLGTVTDIIGGVTGAIGGVTGGTTGGNPLGTVTDIIGGVTGAIGGVTGGTTGGNPLGTVTDIIGGVTGAIGGVTGGTTGGNPLGTVTDIIGGVTGGIIGGGTSPISPVVDAVQSGIDVLQGVESLKTSIINTGINTVADTVVGVLPQTEHPVTDIAHLGTLTFETSRDTVNGALEVVSDLVGGNIQGATDHATGIVNTLVSNGTTATGILTDILGGVTGAIGGVTGGNPLGTVTDIIGGLTGGNPLGTVTDIIGGVTGGIIGGGTSPISPVVDAVQSGIDVLQGVESLKTSIINTGINTVADTVVGVLPQTEHPVTDIAHLGTLTFETSRDTVNGALEVVSDLVGGNIQGATDHATGIVNTLVSNGTTAAGILTDILGGATGAIGGVTGGVGGDSPLGTVTDIIGGLTGGATGSNPLGTVTDIIGGVTGGTAGSNPIGVVTDIVGSLTGGVTGTGGTDVISNLLGGVTGNLGGVTSTVSNVTDTVHTLVPQSLLTDHFLNISVHTV
ncbi:beta strand repeat-containing protein [Acinetobacter nosocomialis]|uniref:beta strand repeat-containing protein n=1 Tax=Acinetobacter nosocomialis TaxID=106654 RepID=UPI00396F446C